MFAAEDIGVMGHVRGMTCVQYTMVFPYTLAVFVPHGGWAVWLNYVD